MTSNAIMSHAVVLQSTACAEHIVQVQNSTLLLSKRVRASPPTSSVGLDTAGVAVCGNAECCFTSWKVFCKHISSEFNSFIYLLIKSLIE